MYFGITVNNEFYAGGFVQSDSEFRLSSEIYNAEKDIFIPEKRIVLDKSSLDSRLGQ